MLDVGDLEFEFCCWDGEFEVLVEGRFGFEGYGFWIGVVLVVLIVFFF